MESSVYRIIDANINRAMEGIRVCEDILRFLLDSDLSGEFKKLRHSLKDYSESFPPLALLRSRDVEGDAQKFINTESEMKRNSVKDIYSANIHRIIEALRVLEETAKTLKEGNSPLLQEMRFRLYEFEKKFMVKLAGAERREKLKGSLYAILDSGFIGSLTYSETAERMIKGGASVIQLRMKGEPSSCILETAKELAEICRMSETLFMVNDYPDIALLAGADGLHLGQDDIPLSEARKILPEDMIIGISTHSPDQALDALKDSPDYIAIGPLFDTESKYGDLIRGIGTDIIKRIKEASRIPVVAIGGITGENIKSVFESGADSAAMISALYRNGTIKENCRELVNLIA
jgi:thiamine-phosphate pyrophosphorylase